MANDRVEPDENGGVSSRYPGSERRLLFGLSAASVGVSAAFTWQGSDVYDFVFGGLNPVAVTVAACCVGIVSLSVLRRRSRFKVLADGTASYGLVVGLGIVLTFPVIAMDWAGGFPRDMNVPLPSALLFYPAIALVAEFLFHAMPLAVFCLALPVCAPGGGPRTRWAALISVAGVEPAFQVAWGFGQSPPWVNAYVGFHLLAFNLAGLVIFERRGFLAMYVLRLAYYAVWHVIWGHARLAVLWG